MNQTEQIDLLLRNMMRFNRNDPKRIQHLMKVHRFAQMIGRMEALDAHTQFLTECAALVHDIGIRPAEEKYGNCNGKLQEQEGLVCPQDARGVVLRSSRRGTNLLLGGSSSHIRKHPRTGLSNPRRGRFLGEFL